MSKRPTDIPEVEISRQELVGLLAELCPEHRIDLAGAVALPSVQPHRKRWHEWLAADRHADLEYVTRDPAAREDPTQKNPWARSVLIFGQRYTDGWSADEDVLLRDVPWTDRVARYARGHDYHDVLLKDIKRVAMGLIAAIPGFAAFSSTDTGPYLEREYAWLAGLGFMGKNTCLIHEKLGSGLFLGVALTNLRVVGLPPGNEPQAEPLYAIVPRRRRTPTRILANHCGSCTACLDACPTDALLPTGGLDARSCISTWTIEWRGMAPDDRRAEQGGLLFGCDICQSVCPWNQRAAERDTPLPVREQYGVLPTHGELKLADLAVLNDDDFRTRFRRTPLWRAHPEGLRRNAEVVLENLADQE
ncbi:MAG: DUF1730 domain-containing protein [Candidatus Krumholzibacteria bacterium]|nr:DUF1730 domain-containing protein [Candidatus Krumholzibacteria bacterium]